MQHISSSQKQTLFIPPFESDLLDEPKPNGGRLRARLRSTLREWGRRYRLRSRLRRQLREMDIALAEKDVGLPIGSLVEEAGKPFWKA